MIIKAGTILVLTSGSYSDVSWDGPHKVLMDFDQAEVTAAYTMQYVKSKEWHQPNISGFTAWLTTQGYIEVLENTYDWYLGDYYLKPEITDEPS